MTNISKSFTTKNLAKGKMKNAFTLAEVLITLGIIGIVAAMTIPTLIQNTQERELKTAWKKQYSVLNQVIQQIYAEDNDSYSIAQYPAWTDMPKYLCKMQNRLKIIQSGFDCSNESTPVATGNEPSLSAKIKDGTGVLFNSGYSRNRIQTNDGATIYFTCSNLFIVDVNGQRKPNTIGKDIFYFFLSQSGDRKTSFWGNVNGCASPSNVDVSRSNYNTDCESGTGWGCSPKYILEN